MGQQGVRQDQRLVHREGAVAGGLVAAGVVTILAFLVLREWEPLLQLDAAIEDAVHRWALQAPVAVSVSETLSLIGGTLMSTVATVIVLAVLLLARRWWVALAFGLTATLAPFLTDEVIKPLVDRPRPEWAVPIVPVPDSPAFPSGHATAGLAVWLATGVALSVLLRTHTGKAWFVFPWVLLGFSIGLSRIVLGVHWPSDVLAGWCVATAVAGIACALLVLPSKRAPATSRRGAPPPAKPSRGAVPEAVKETAPEGAPAPEQA